MERKKLHNGPILRLPIFCIFNEDSSWMEYFQLLIPCDKIIIYGRSRSHELLYYFNYLTFVAEPEKSRSKIDGGTFDLDVFKLRKE